MKYPYWENSTLVYACCKSEIGRGCNHRTSESEYNAELIINGETIDIKRLPVSSLDKLIKYFKEQ